jgi:hypothetical protein
MKKFSTTLGLMSLTLGLMSSVGFSNGLFAADAGPILAAPANGEVAKESHSVLKPAETTKANQSAAPASASLPAPEQITPMPMSVMPESKVAPSTVLVPANPAAPPIVIDIPDVHGTNGIPTAYEPDIIYRERGHRKRCHDSCDDVEVVLAVKNPRTDCIAIVPVCVPCGCIDPTCITDRNALFCRGIVNYKYGNGFRIQMIFDAKGDVKVVYHYV